MPDTRAQWLLQQRGRESLHGTDELKALARGGKLEPGDLVYHPILGRWLYARQVEEIAADLQTALTLGRRNLPGGPVVHNDAAVAGFTLGVLSVVPVFGILPALVGLPLAVHGLRRSRASGGTDRRFAIAGAALSAASLLINGGVTLLAALS
jgi:hypothetical protein